MKNEIFEFLMKQKINAENVVIEESKFVSITCPHL